MTTQDRLYATLQEKLAGRGPCYLDMQQRRPAQARRHHAARTCRWRRQRAMLLQDEMYYGRGGGSMAPVEITGSEPHVVGGHGLSGFWIDVARGTDAAGSVGRG